MNFFDFIIYIIVFVYGSVVGSFLNVLIYRFPIGIPVVKGRSFCPVCKIKLRVDDLIPILSYIRLRGKCRNCNNKIDIRYPFVEFFTGGIAIITVYAIGLNIEAILVFIIASILIVIALIDLDTMTIPNETIISLIPFALLLIFFKDRVNMISILTGFFIISLPMYSLNIFIKGGFGGGDIKLMAICGAMLGWKSALVSGVIAIFIAGMYSSYMLIFQKIKLGTHIAFGPYLCLGVYISLLYGDIIMDKYIALLNL